MFKLTSKTYPTFQDFKFKNLKSIDTLDGISYACEFFHKRNKIADVHNDGLGGPISIIYTDKGEKLFNSLNVEQYQDKKNINFDIDNEYMIGDLIELSITIKGALKNQTSAILYLIDDKIMEVKFKYSLNQICKMDKKSHIEKQIQKIKKDGGLILNTNLNRLDIDV